MHRIRIFLVKRIKILAALLVFTGLSLAGLAEQPHEKQKESAEKASQCSIAVVRSGAQIATVTAELLTGLETVDLTLPDVKKTQSGPRLLDLLTALKVTEYKQVKAYGYAKGRLATAEYTILKENMHDRIILSYSRRGTAKLAVPELAFDDWLVDVYKLEIE
ncbi:MAG: hypothetical protein A2W80_05005 [Candidatus Riflebacteria bacterium GWC2_50_8]|nr:MAG: hypothetical protein A2W80_05005 [Candidatus Riflebacteria bacterium GWC2_50_8]